MQDSVDFNDLVKKYPEFPYALMAALSYTISIIFGISEIGNSVEFYGVKFHLISTTLWAFFGILSLYLLYTAFFDMWIYAIHLIFAYILAGAGFLAIYLFYDNITIRILSSALIFASFVFILYFIFQVGNIRSYRIMNSPDIETAKEKFSLRSWYLFPFVFLGIAAVSFMDLAYWYENTDHSPYIHVIAEILLILTVIYLLWKPENILFYGTKEYGTVLPTQTLGEGFGGILGKQPSEFFGKGTGATEAGVGAGKTDRDRTPSKESRVRRKKSVVTCPGFDTPAVTMKKNCPHCHSVNTFDWCPPSEEFLVDCPACGNTTYYGRKVCVHCKSHLEEKIACSGCGKRYPVRKFKDVR